VDRVGYDEIARDLHGLVIRLADRLTAKDRLLIAEFIDVGEVGLALEQIADVLSEYEQPAHHGRALRHALPGRANQDGNAGTSRSELLS